MGGATSHATVCPGKGFLHPKTPVDPSHKEHFFKKGEWCPNPAWFAVCEPTPPPSTSARSSQCWSWQTQHGLRVCIWMHLVNGTGNSPSLGWGGGGLRSAIYRNLPQFYAIFSDAPIQKLHFPPAKNSFTPFADTRHTVRCMCSHLSCMSFVWQDTSLLLCSQNVVHFWGQ